MGPREAEASQTGPLEKPTDPGSNAVPDISDALNVLLADLLALNFRVMSWPHFRDHARPLLRRRYCLNQVPDRCEGTESLDRQRESSDEPDQ
jgi:hypothetical protein